MAKKTRYVCPLCGSDDIDAEAWADINSETINNFSEGGDNFCNGCDEHFKGWCEVDIATGKCVQCYFSDPADHEEGFKPLENMTPRGQLEVENIQRAKFILRDALLLLAEAGAPKSAQRVRLALSSVCGALSNARHRQQRPERKRIRRAPRVAVATLK